MPTADACPAAVPAPIPPAASGAETTVLAWRVHRLRTEPGRLGIVLIGYAVALGMWYLLFPHPVALFLPLVGLTCALREYLFPQEFRLTTRGAHVANGPARLFLAWEDVKRATHGRDGVHLSPFARPTRLDDFRGVRLDFADGNDAAVLATVRRLWRGETEAGPEESHTP
jgi:hypothetical protein